MEDLYKHIESLGKEHGYKNIYSLPNIFRFHCAAVAPQPIAQFYPCITQIFFRFFYFILGYHGVLWMSITRGGT